MPANLPPGFTALTKLSSGGNPSDECTVSIHYVASSLSRRLYEDLGKPARVLFATDAAGNLALVPTDERDGYVVNRQNRAVNVGSKRLSDRFRNGRYMVRVVDGIGYVDASNAGAVTDLDARRVA